VAEAEPAAPPPPASSSGRLSVDGAVSRISKPVTFLRAFATKYAPWISLGLGVLARVLNKHDVQFAPKAVALLVIAWTLPAIMARLLPPPLPDAPEPGWRRATRTVGAPFAVVVLYKNILFFLVPIWFGAAHFPSLNMGVPLLLAAMALATCFAHWYQRQIIEHPVRRVLWSAVVLFAALVPALEVMAFASPRVSLFLAALLSAAVATAALRGAGASILSRRALAGILAGAIPVAALVVLAAPLLPPVPADCLDKGAGTAIVSRNLVDRAESFPRGTHRVYAWFAVSLPARYRQQVIYKWFHDGHAVGEPIVTNIEGGRAGGYRTATSKVAPAPGRWRADLLNEAGQLVSRVSFDVLP
jgi:hypothetical protein